MDVKGAKVCEVAEEIYQKGDTFKAFVLRRAKNKIDALTLTLNFLQDRVSTTHPEHNDAGETEIRKQIRAEITKTKDTIKGLIDINIIFDENENEPLRLMAKQGE
jgi:predicted RNase H-like nuclease